MTGLEDLGSLPAAPSVPSETEAALPARRAKLVLNDHSTIGFSIPAGVTTAAALADVRRFHLAIAKGRSRQAVCIDGPPGRARYRVTSDGFKRIKAPFPVRAWLWWAWRVAMSYAEKWLTIARRATIDRHLVALEMAEIDAAIVKATTAAKTVSVGMKPEGRNEPSLPTGDA